MRDITLAEKIEAYNALGNERSIPWQRHLARIEAHQDLYNFGDQQFAEAVEMQRAFMEHGRMHDAALRCEHGLPDSVDWRVAVANQQEEAIQLMGIFEMLIDDVAWALNRDIGKLLDVPLSGSHLIYNVCTAGRPGHVTLFDETCCDKCTAMRDRWLEVKRQRDELQAGLRVLGEFAASSEEGAAYVQKLYDIKVANIRKGAGLPPQEKIGEVRKTSMTNEELDEFYKHIKIGD